MYEDGAILVYVQGNTVNLIVLLFVDYVLSIPRQVSDKSCWVKLFKVFVVKEICWDVDVPDKITDT